MTSARTAIVAWKMTALSLLVVGCAPGAWRYAPSDTAIERVRGVPRGAAERQATLAVDTFNRLYGRDVEIVAVDYRGAVTDVAATVDEMMRTLAIPASDGPAAATRIVTASEAGATVPPAELARLRTSLAANLAPGDYLLLVRLEVRATGVAIETLNSMRPDGSGFSGTFFGTARGEPAGGSSVQLPNTVCETRVISTYLWGSPAETARGCARVTCDGPRPIDCKVTEANCFGGFFAECKIVPPVGTAGAIVGPCCDCAFNYAWATGFKKVKVAGGGTSLEIEGRIGQSGNGGFTATECCDVESAGRRR